jgi:hypothetical protein
VVPEHQQRPLLEGEIVEDAAAEARAGRADLFWVGDHLLDGRIDVRGADLVRDLQGIHVRMKPLADVRRDPRVQGDALEVEHEGRALLERPQQRRARQAVLAAGDADEQAVPGTDQVVLAVELADVAQQVLFEVVQFVVLHGVRKGGAGGSAPA